MQVISRIEIDLVRGTPPQQLKVHQGDVRTRLVEVVLYADGAAWPVPDCTIAVRYRKSDGKGGVYAKIAEDGTNACTVSGNKIIARLAQQVCSCPGLVKVDLQLSADDTVLHTFTFDIDVEAAAVPDGHSEDYYYLLPIRLLGDLAALDTTAKGTLVDAINELVSDYLNLDNDINILSGNVLQKSDIEGISADVALLNKIVIDDLNENAVRGVNGKRGDELGVVSIDSSDIMVPSDAGLPMLGTVTDLLNYSFQQIRTVESKANTTANQIPAINDALTQLNADYSGVVRSINGIAPAPGNGTVEISSSDITMENEGYDWNGNVTDALDKVQREIEELQQGGGSASAYKDVTTAYEQGGGTMSARAYIETLADGLYCIKTLSENYYFFKTTVNGQVYLRQTVYYDDDSGVEEEIYCNGVKMELPSAGETDVQINGTSIVQGGVANIPLSGSLEYADGFLKVRQTAVENVTQRVATRALTLDKLDSAVKAALCDGAGAAWTAEEQAAARARLGILTTEGVTF